MIYLKNLKFFIYGALAFVSVIMIRCIQIALLTDAENGFFYDRYEGVGNALSLLILGIVAVAAVFGFFIHTDNISSAPRPSYVLGGAALLTGIAQLTELFGHPASLEGVFPLLVMLRTVFILGSAIIFCYFGIMYILGSQPNYAFVVIPIFSWVLRLISTFISFTGMSNISDNLCDVLMLVSTSIFLLLHGKQLCKIHTKKELSMTFVFGIIAALTTAVAILPRWIIAFAGINEFDHVQVDSPLASFFMAVYIVVYLVNICNNESTKAE